MVKATAKKAPARKRAAARPAAATKRAVTDEHKAAMQQGRTDGAAIRRYLEALKIETAPKKRGRKRTPDQIRERITAIDGEIGNGLKDPLAEVQLRQERRMLTEALEENEPSKVKSADFEDDFVKALKGYSERKGIDYDVWREIGVPVVVLRKAGVTK